MSKFAVGYVNLYDENLIIEIIDAENWREAFYKHSQIKEESKDWGDYFNDCTFLEAKRRAYKLEMMIDVVEIK